MTRKSSLPTKESLYSDEPKFDVLFQVLEITPDVCGNTSMAIVILFYQEACYQRMAAL